MGGYLGRGWFLISDYIAPYYLRFDHVQLALKRYRRGILHGSSLEDLKYTDLRFFDNDAYFFTVEARIVSGDGEGDGEDELLLRSQEWIISSQHPMEQFVDMRITYGVCQHLMAYNDDFGLDNSFTGVLRCRLGHGLHFDIKPVSAGEDEDGFEEDGDEKCACMHLHQCKTCHMEYQLDIVDLRDLGAALCVTKWLNLGAGEMASDSRWKGHDLSPDEPMPHRLRFGTIRGRFEEMEGRSVDEIMEGRGRELLGSLVEKRGRVVMRDRGLGWQEVGGGPRVDHLEIPRNRSFCCSFAPEDWMDIGFLAVVFVLAVILFNKIVCEVLARSEMLNS